MKWNWFGRIVVALSFCVLAARSAAHVPDSPWEMAAETVLARDAAGRVVSSTDPLGRVTRFGWTPDGHLSFVRDPCGGVSTNVWDAFGRLVRAEDARGGVRSFEYDAAGHLVRVADGLGAETFVRDALGLVVSVTNALGDAITFERDPLGRPVLTVDPLGAETGIGYDLLDRPVSTIDPLGRIRSVTRDALGRPLSFVRPSGAVETFAWDALGALAAVADAEGGTVTVARDAFGRPTAVTNACGERVFSVSRDAAGRTVSRTNGNGDVRTFVYDAVGRLLRSEGPSGTDEFAYDAVGGLLLASNAIVAESFVPDGCGRTVFASFSFPAGPTLAVALFRDAGGLVTNAVLPSGVSVVRVFDADGRPVSVSAGPGRSWTFAHDAAGRLVSVSGPDGRADTLSFDASGRVSGWSAGGFAGRAILRDAAGRRIRDAVTAGAVPAPVADRAFELAFDAAGRPVSGTLRLGAAAPLPLAFLHDGNGALTNLLAGGAPVLSVARDDAGRPVSAQGEAFFRDACGAVVATERGGVRRLWIPAPDDPLGRPLVECDESGSPLRTYVWSGSRLLGFLDATNGLVVAHCDEQGSVVALSDPAGVLLHSAAYGPFGEDWGSSGENPTPFAWLGSWGVRRVPRSDAVGPLFLTARRLYAPSLRRFLSPDPLGPAGGLNPYAYGEDNPLEWIDPFGLCPVHDPLGDMANGSDSSGVEFLTRLGGFAQMVGGTLESALGLGFAVFTAETGAGVVGGLAVAYHGWDVATAGWDTMVSGDPQDSMSSQAMQSLGVPRNYANGIDAGFSIIGTMGVGSAMSAGYKESTFSLSEYNHQIANNIANGHAYTRHSAQFGFTTREEMAAHIERIMNHPSAMKPLARGRMAFWDDASQTIVIFDPYRVDQGTAFIPDHGLRYFLEEIK